MPSAVVGQAQIPDLGGSGVHSFVQREVRISLERYLRGILLDESQAGEVRIVEVDFCLVGGRSFLCRGHSRVQGEDKAGVAAGKSCRHLLPLHVEGCRNVLVVMAVEMEPLDSERVHLDRRRATSERSVHVCP